MTIAHPAHTSTREERGLALYRERGDEIKHVRRSVWSVPSCTCPGIYLVDQVDGICTCGDMPPAGEVCKHATAATVVRAKTAECAGCGGRSRRRDMVECFEDNHDGLTYFDGDQLCRVCADNAGVVMCDMRRVTDFRTGELRIPTDRFPLPARVEELLRIYSGFGRWEGSPHAPGSVAIFELPVYRLEEIEAAFEDAAGDVRS